MTSGDAQKLIAQIEHSNAKLISYATRTGDSTLKAFIAAQNKMLVKMEEMIVSMPKLSSLSIDSRLRWYAANANQIGKALNDSGYYNVVKGFVPTYSKLGELTGDVLKSTGFGGGAFTEIPSNYIEFLQQRDTKYFNFLGMEANQKLDRLLLEQVVVGSSGKDMLEVFRGNITGEYPWGNRQGLFEWHAGTYANTALHRSSQMYMNEQVESWNKENPEETVENFLYSGPNDGLTRDFCSDLVGNIYSADEIADMDNDQTGDVMVDRGGWNCRHDWIPVSSELAVASELQAPHAARGEDSDEKMMMIERPGYASMGKSMKFKGEAPLAKNPYKPITDTSQAKARFQKLGLRLQMKDKVDVQVLDQVYKTLCNDLGRVKYKGVKSVVFEALGASKNEGLAYAYQDKIFINTHWINKECKGTLSGVNKYMQERFKKGFISTGDLKGVLDHEFGHIFSTTRKFDILSMSGSEWKGISKYASTAQNIGPRIPWIEGWAETFARYKSGVKFSPKAVIKMGSYSNYLVGTKTTYKGHDEIVQLIENILKKSGYKL